MSFHTPAHKNVRNPAAQFSAPPAPVRDFRLCYHGSVSILFPLTEAAREWCEANIPDAGRWANGYAIEHRFVEDIVVGASDDGLGF